MRVVGCRSPYLPLQSQADKGKKDKNAIENKMSFPRQQFYNAAATAGQFFIEGHDGANINSECDH